MEDIVIINNLTYNMDEKCLFDNLSLNITNGSFTTLLGVNGSGKTILSQILVGLKKCDADISINGIKLIDENQMKYKKNIGYIPSDINDTFLMDTVKDELLLNNNLKKRELENVIESFKLKDLLNMNPNSLSGGQKQLLYIATIIVKNPKIIILDDAFSMTDSLSKTKILKLLKKINKEKSITILNITNDVEESLYGENIAVLHNGKIIINDRKEIVFNNDKLFKNTRIETPFVIDISKKLRYYNLLEKLEYNVDGIINKIWK